MGKTPSPILNYNLQLKINTIESTSVESTLFDFAEATQKQKNQYYRISPLTSTP